MRLYFFSLLIFLFNIVSAYGRSSEEYVISPCVITQDCVGAYNKDDFNFLMNVILAKDKEAYLKMILEGRVYFFKKGQRVYLQRVHWSGVNEVRPEGETYIVWVNSSFVDCSGKIPLESYQSENNKKQVEYKPETSKLILTEIAHVYLKNGNVLEGKIAKKTEEGIYLEVLNGKGKIFVRHSEIEKIERSEFSKPSSSSLVCDLERGTLGYLQIGAFTNYKNIIKNLGEPDRVTKELFGTDYKYFNKGIIIVLSSNSKIYEIYVYFQNLEEFDGFYKKFIGRIKQLNEYENILTIKKKFGTPAREIEDIIYKTPELVYKTSYGTLHFCFNNNGELVLIVMREE